MNFILIFSQSSALCENQRKNVLKKGFLKYVRIILTAQNPETHSLFIFSLLSSKEE